MSMVESVTESLSCVVVNRNTADLLMTCLEHLFASELDHEPEVVVVDNGSTDDSVARVRDRFPQVSVLQAGRNLGFSAAVNRGVKQGAGDLVLVVNTDAMLERDCCHTLAELMRTVPKVGMAGPQLLNEDGSFQTSYEAVPTLATETLNRSLLKRLFPTRFPGKNRCLFAPEPVEALIGAVVMIRRSALEQLGGFDEDYFFFLEETDLALRMREAGWTVMHHPRARALHLQGATANTLPSAARIEFYRSRYVFFRKNYGSGSAGLLKVVLTANLLLNALFLGLGTIATLGRARRMRDRFRVRTDLLVWHLQGCPDSAGLPRD
jgi:GT2 family glycosyltransferase